MSSTERTALLLLDYQVGLCEEGPHTLVPALAEQVRQRAVLERAAEVLHATRRSESFIAHVRLAFDPTYVLRTNRSARFDSYPRKRAMLFDSPEARTVEELKSADGEPVVDKGCVDPFVGTPLLHVLASEEVRHVVLGGVATNLVVESAARHATDVGLRVTVVEDMCASFAADLHEFSIDKIMPMFAEVSTSADVVGDLS